MSNHHVNRHFFYVLFTGTLYLITPFTEVLTGDVKISPSGKLHFPQQVFHFCLSIERLRSVSVPVILTCLIFSINFFYRPHTKIIVSSTHI